MVADPSNPWPPLPYAEWRDTRDTLHRWLQIVGKVKLALTPLVNHWWNVAFYVTPRGLTTGTMPYGSGALSLTFDFLDAELVVETSRGERRGLALLPRPVAWFYDDVLALLGSLGVDVRIWDHPVEIPSDTIPFHEDEQHRSFEAEPAQRFWRILLSTSMVLARHRAAFRGKACPVHFFWGSMDLAQTRFSGRPAPARPGADPVTREAYSDECWSAGFWPGDERYQRPAFYAYAAPAPPGMDRIDVGPGAFWSPSLGEHILDYDEARSAPDPAARLLEFCERSYEAAAALGGWDRERLERGPSAAPDRQGAGAPAPGA